MKRYSVSYDASAPESVMLEDREGEYVTYEDAEKLVQALQRQRKFMELDGTSRLVSGSAGYRAYNEVCLVLRVLGEEE